MLQRALHAERAANVETLRLKEARGVLGVSKKANEDGAEEESKRVAGSVVSGTWAWGQIT